MLNTPKLNALTLDACSTSMLCIGSDASLLFANQAAIAQLGFTRDELLAKPFLEIAPDLSPTWPKWWSRFADARSMKIETRLLRKDGAAVSVEMSIDLMEDDGQAYLFAVASETAERASAVDALSRSESIQQSIMESSLDSIMLLNREGRILFINRTVPGLTREEVVNTPIFDYVSEDYHPSMRACFDRVLTTGEPDGFEVEYPFADDGRVSVWESRVAPVRAGGEITGLTVIARDVTAHRNSLSSLQKSERSLATAQRIARIGSWEFDVASGEPTGTSEMYRIMGIDDSEPLLTMTDFLNKVVHSDDRQSLIDALHDTIANGETSPMEFRIRRQSDNEIRYIRAEAEFIAPENDGQPQLIGTFQDITSQRADRQAFREMETQLAHVARLSTMGEMVAGIAHEINQPLSAIANFALASSNAVRSSNHDFDIPIEKWLEQINEQAVRCGDIIRRLGGFVKKDRDERQWLDLNQVVRDSVALVGSDVGQHLQVFQIELDNSNVLVLANRIELQQVMVNLLRNACDATNDVDSPIVQIQVSSERERALLSIQDNGPGVELDAVPRLFDAFFTTKSDGMGMGLAISKSIIESHRGRLRLVQSESQGAKFLIELPAVKAIEGGAQNTG